MAAKISKIGSDLLRQLYADHELETIDPQPVYILQKDTIKAFLYEKANEINKIGLVWGLLGINITIVLTILTADFKNKFGINGDTIKGFFWTVFLFIAAYIIRNIKCLFKFGLEEDIDKMVTELGGKGSVLKAKTMEDKLGSENGR